MVPWYPWPMKLLRSRFRAAMPFSSSSAAASVTAAGSRIGSRRAMLTGTMASMSVSHDAAPIAASIRASSAAVGPMWRP